VIEEFLYREAALLDAWDLDAWLALWTDDGRYIVSTGDPGTHLGLISDDLVLLRERVAQLRMGASFAERPRSRTVHVVTNVYSPAPQRVASTLIVYRSARDRMDMFVATVEHVLVEKAGTLRIYEKRVALANPTLEAGRIGIIL
jgi:p-cumate 2,3-dioxygenase beta subunit